MNLSSVFLQAIVSIINKCHKALIDILSRNLGEDIEARIFRIIPCTGIRVAWIGRDTWAVGRL